MNFNSHCVFRLKEERKRLRLTQGDVADICGISREMWGKYERGVAIPGGEVFASFATAGANIQYILTGEKSSGIDITADESELLAMYRNAPLAIKAAALGALTAGTEQKGIGVNISNISNMSGGQVAGGGIYNSSRKGKK